MAFVGAYRSLKPGIVAIIPTFYGSRPSDFPEILGTGFFVSQHGVGCTCRHVADAIRSLPTPPGFQGFAAQAMLFLEMECEGEKGVAMPTIPIEKIGDALVMGDTSEYRGPNPPDVSFLLLSVTETAAVTLATDPLQEGEEVAFAGFPMGTKTLRAPGWLHQFSPTLHSGALSTILPNHTAKMPHAFLVHANTQGGASGSPVFRENGEVIGMVYGVLHDRWQMGGQSEDIAVLEYSVPTSLTVCVPARVITEVLNRAEKGIPAAPRETLSEFLNARSIRPVSEIQDSYEPWNPPTDK